MRQIVEERSIKLVVERVFPLQKEISGHNLTLVNCEHQKPMLLFHKMTPDVFEKAVRLRKQAVFVFPYFQVHLEKDAQFLLRLRHSNREPLALRLPDRAVRRIVHSFPQRVEIPQQIQAVPFRLLHYGEPLVTKWQVIVQAAHTDRVAFGH